MKKLVPTAIAMLIVLFLYLFAFDDALNPQVTTVLEKHNGDYTTLNNGSVYQLGMWASLNESPYDVGLLRLKLYKKALAKGSFKYQDHQSSDWNKLLTLPQEQTVKCAKEKKLGLLCDASQYACLASIYKNAQQANQLLAEKANLIARYDGLLAYDKFERYAKPAIELPMMEFGPRRKLLQLKLLLAFEQVRLKDYKKASEELARLVTFHQNVLAQTPYMTAKITSMMDLALTLDTAAFLLSKTDKHRLADWHMFMTSLTQLTGEQLNFDEPILLDFSGVAKAIVKATASSIRGEGSWFSYLPSVLIYKPNRTLNQLFFETTVNMGKMRFVGDFIVSEETEGKRKKPTVDYTNFVGSALYITAAPRFTNFGSGLFDLEVKQRMIKHLFANSTLGTPSRAIDETVMFKSPYTAEVAVIDDHQFCVASNPANNAEIKRICITAF